MVLSVLWCAGAVPLSDDHPHELPAQFVLPSHFQLPAAAAAAAAAPSTAQQQPSTPHQPEYVQFLESLVGELSCVFANWVHQNPPVSPTQLVADMYQQQRNSSNTCRSTRARSSGAMSPLPDVIPQHCSDKWATSCSTPARNGAELRVRRGMAPMRFRLDSVGSSVGDSTASSPITSPTSPTPYSPMSFDLLPESYPPPDSALSTSSAFSYDFRPEDVLSSTLIASSASTSDATDASPSSADWRRVGRDLRGIADHFASSRLQNPQCPSSPSSWPSSLSSSSLSFWTSSLSVLGSPLTSTGPLVSALAVYLWWKLVRRLTA